ncbi:MAG: hypothetical protein KKH28_03445 [Elusimicrobia bacterium]|nr:hypothetical protein [Elusimicrobiota bacterium]
MGIWKNAFKLPGHGEITEEEKKILSGLAEKINKRSMGMVTSLAFESTRPLHNLGAQGLIFLMPMLNAVFNKTEIEKFIKLLENPNAVSFFIARLNPESANPVNPVREQLSSGQRSTPPAGAGFSNGVNNPARERDHVKKRS